MMNAYIRPLILYLAIYGGDQYLNDAISLSRLFKRHLRIDNNSYLWPYWWGLYTQGWADGDVSVNHRAHIGLPLTEDVSDIDHSSIDLRSILYLYKLGYLYDKTDIDLFKNRVSHLLDYRPYVKPLLIHGRITSANYGSIFFLLSKFSCEDEYLYCKFRHNINNMPYLQDAFLPWGRFEIVAYSLPVKLVENCMSEIKN